MTPPAPLLVQTPAGLYCPPGGFHIDPARGVPLAVITHAHADHARPGSARYLCASASRALVEHRIGRPGRGAAASHITAHPYGARFTLGEATVSLHPAGHILGSAQVRIERDGEVLVVSGDYKRAPDPTCAPFEVVPCDTFVTEATFAHPAFRWDPPEAIARQILDWWEAGTRARRPSVLGCYALGKAERVLAELYRLVPGRRAFVHPDIASLVALYRAAGVAMLATEIMPIPGGARAKGGVLDGELVLVPPQSLASPTLGRLGRAQTALVSGWMLHGAPFAPPRGRARIDRGFALSDHADHPALLGTALDTGARRVLAMHGRGADLARELTDRGLDARALEERAAAFRSAP